MSGKIVSLVSTKGGCGKSTLALTLAHAKPFQGMRVAILEADRQGSLPSWWNDRQEAGRNGGAPVRTFYEDKAGPLAGEIERLAESHDLVFIDCPGESTAYVKTRVALGISDVVLIPVRASEFDMDSVVSHVLPLLNQAQEKGVRDTQYFLLPVMVHHASRMEKTVESFEGTQAKVLRAYLPYRKVYAEFSEGGRTLHDFSLTGSPRGLRKKARQAMRDIDAIAGELAKALGLL